MASSAPMPPLACSSGTVIIAASPELGTNPIASLINEIPSATISIQVSDPMAIDKHPVISMLESNSPRWCVDHIEKTVLSGSVVIVDECANIHNVPCVHNAVEPQADHVDILKTGDVELYDPAVFPSGLNGSISATSAESGHVNKLCTGERSSEAHTVMAHYANCNMVKECVNVGQ